MVFLQVRHQPHLKSVPDYIVPNVLKKASVKSRRRRIEQQQQQKGKKALAGPMSQAKKRFQKKRADPLKNLM